MNHHDPQNTRIAILIGTSATWGRNVIYGIDRYLRKVSDYWHIFIQPLGSNQNLRLPEGWVGDGVIADIHDIAMARRLYELDIPVVTVSQCSFKSMAFPQVTTDLNACCDMAAKYYFSRGFENVAYIQLERCPHDAAMSARFKSFVEQAGGQCFIFTVKKHSWGVPDWNMSISQLVTWLKKLPKPIGLFSWAIGREVVHACHLARIKMPEDVSLVLFSEDEIFSEMCQIPISGLMHPCHQIGHEAARMLDQMMASKSKSWKENPPKVLLKPTGIKTRQSSDILAVSDRALKQAIAYIHQHISQPLQIEKIALHVGLSRRSLEQKFIRYLERTPGEYIRNSRMERAKELLRETTMPIAEVAEATGFTSPEYFAQYFKSQVGNTPLRYRNEKYDC